MPQRVMKTEVELNGRRFEVVAALQSERDAVLDSVLKWEFQRERRWSLCCEIRGGCFERKNTDL
jgi:hypothetical protein